MGGGGSYYDRDVTDRGRVSSGGFSKQAERELSNTIVNKALLPKNRQLVCEAKSPIVFAFDITGSMGTLPKIIWDKMPMLAGQLAECGYLEEPELCLAAVGDTWCDSAPMQICDFSEIRKLDSWLKRLWLEGGGGGQEVESYELFAYFGAKMIEMPNAKTPFFIFTGDEGFREDIPAAELTARFGGRLKATTAKEAFDALRQKFKNNVFLIHRRYSGDDDGIVRQWKKALGKERVIILGKDKAIADVTLGLFAIMGGKLTLDEYCESLKNRVDVNTGKRDPQSKERIASVRKSLKALESIRPAGTASSSQITPAKADKSPKTTGSEKKSKKEWKL